MLRKLKIKKINGIQQELARLLPKLKNESPLIRSQAVESLSKLDQPVAAVEVIKALSDSNPAVRMTAALCLGEMNQRDAVTALIEKLSDPYYEVRLRVVEALGILLSNKKKSPAKLLKRMKDPNELVRIEVADSLGAIGDKSALPVLWRAIHDRSPLVRGYVAGAIGELGTKRDIPRLMKELKKEKNNRPRLGYFQSLYLLGEHRVLPDILRFLQRGDYRLRCAAANTLCDFVVDKKNVDIILKAFRSALKTEQNSAVRSTFRKCLREINQRFR